MSRQRSDVARPARFSGAVVGLGTLAVAAVGALGLLIMRAERPPEGPVPIAWDREVCANCHMHVGEPGLAAQAQLTDGSVLNFDDPGCLFQWLDGAGSPPAALYVRHHSQDRWLAKNDAVFVSVGATPMGFGLGAVHRSERAGLSWAQAGEQVRHRRHGAGHP